MQHPRAPGPALARLARHLGGNLARAPNLVAASSLESSASPPPAVVARLLSAVLALGNQATQIFIRKNGTKILKEKIPKEEGMVVNIRGGLAIAAPPCLAALLYCNTLNHGFVYDDR